MTRFHGSKKKRKPTIIVPSRTEVEDEDDTGHKRGEGILSFRPTVDGDCWKMNAFDSIYSSQGVLLAAFLVNSSRVLHRLSPLLSRGLSSFLCLLHSKYEAARPEERSKIGENQIMH